MNWEGRSSLGRTRKGLRLLFLAASLIGEAQHLSAQETVCATTKLELSQQATLEREAFDARLTLDNPTSQALQNLFVNVSITNPDGSPADSLFFVKVKSLAGTANVSGTGVVQSSGTADIHWIIIPSTGAGGVNPIGLTYGVKADISFNSGGLAQSIQTFSASITVKAQPALKIEHVLPFEVFGDEPLSPAVEAAEPFQLGVRVTNVGFGTARDLKLDSVQPRIIDNKQDLLVDFKLLGTIVGGQTVSNSLLVPLGSIAPGGVAQASWIMSASLSGRFTQLTSTFTHAAELGGALTSLIKSVTTHTLIKDVLVDLPGRDGTPDFLVNATQPRETLQQLFDAGGTPAADFILESDQQTTIPVANVSARLDGVLSGTNASLTVVLTQPVSPGLWIYSSIPFPQGNIAGLLSMRRADGKTINPKNVWISKHFRKSDRTILYRLNILDLSSEASSYALQFDAQALDQPPGPVTDLAAVTGQAGGSLSVSWRAPGEDSLIGNILGGRYLIQTEQNPNAIFSPASAQISRATSTVAGELQSFLLAGLFGNTVHHLRLWTQDAGGKISAVSNGTSAYALPNPPTDLLFDSIGTSSIAVRWQPGNNNEPVVYQVSIASGSSSPFLASSALSFTFTGLTPNTAFSFFGHARNPELSASSQLALLASTVTLAEPPVGEGFSEVFRSSATARWSRGANPPETEFLVELSTSAGRLPVFTSSGWVKAASFTFRDLPPQSYFGRVKARNKNGVETSYADLGLLRFDIAPPITEPVIGQPRFDLPGSIFIAGHTPLALSAKDDLFIPGDGQGLGVRETLFAVDSEPFRLFTGSFTIPGEGLHDWRFLSVDVVGNVESTKTVKLSVDNTPPVTGLVFSSPSFVDSAGSIFVATSAVIGFTAQDPVSSNVASGVSLTEFRVDAATSSAAFQQFASSFTLAEGRHAIDFRSRDNVNNLENTRNTMVLVDATPPESSLIIGTPQFQLPSVLLVSSRTPFFVTAVDPISNSVASGFKETFLRLLDSVPSTAAFASAAAPFSLALPDGTKFIEFFSQDNVLNTEVVKSSSVLLDATPPVAVLLSPSASGLGICSVVKGLFPVLGTVQDAHFKDYRLEVAVGSSAVSGFTLISSGTAGVASGVLGTWDAKALSGWQTLRLTATDLVENASQVSMNVFVGDPGELLTLGNHEIFDLPEGVAVSSSGMIYVADRNNNRIAVFSSTGTLLASLGGREHDEDHHGKLSTGTLRLNKPSDVAVDEAGQVYVADTNNDRLLKLSGEGSILLELERQGKKDDDAKPGKGPGEFNKPSGVAVSSAGNIYVSDRENRRVQVFSSTGALTLQIPLPPIAQKSDDDDDDDKDKEEAGKPAGLAVDGAGNIYVADPKGARVLTFSPSGALLRSLSIVDEQGKRGQPYGVAVTPSGDCLLVSDRKHSLILKFDALGHQTLVFGGKHKKKTSITFNKPMGLALDTDGNLYVADRNNDKVRKFGLPTGQPALVVPAPRPEDEHVARAVVDTEEGGEVLRKDKAGVIVPAEALAEDLKITVSRPEASKSEEKARHGALAEKELKVVSPPISYAPHGTQFEVPVTLVLPYNSDLAQAQKADEASLQVHYWNPNKKEWEALESKVNEKDKTVTAKTKHFSLYQVLAGSSTQTQTLKPLAADPSFAFRDLYVFPNPARAGAKPIIHLAVGIADKVMIRIYDVSGRQVHQTTLFEQPSIINDGTGDKYAYEYAWEGRIASGVYLYVIEAEKQGFGTIRKSGKFGVVR